MGEPKPVWEFDITLYPVEDAEEIQYSPCKALILCWMWFADLATTDQKDPEANFPPSLAAGIASDFSQELEEQHFTARSIQDYYRQVQMNAKTANLSWDSAAVTMILKAQTQYLGTCDDFSNFLDEYGQVVSVDTLSSFLGGDNSCLCVHLSDSWLQNPNLNSAARKLILDVKAQAETKWNSLHECWAGIDSERIICTPDLDAELKAVENTLQPPLTPTQEM